MYSISSIVLVLASAVAAVPLNTVSAISSTDYNCGTATLPVNGGVSELPTPSGTLAYAALGRGIQNYTCSAVGATPVALGAVASLYDATEFAKCNGAAFNNLPNIAVYTSLPSTTSAKFLGLSTLGKHFFDARGTPTFDLYTVNKILYSAKTGDVSAPINASPGPSDTGAVDWLSLSAKATYTSVGLSEVFRVETAGGNSINPCSKVGVQSVQYSAQYWFYS
ncbi:476d371d-e5fe-49ba-9241-58fe27858ba0 [Sclerotinia trifoliorum]|uniref:476d371d-e5fe-49ba-9241-58fe27858ba0 n=1 Tax=Sclerotinia trifoliorum TaxID=28548 RepID=A0A8H2VUE1_9HELO|nr:476d371d-e5fe-49ba-9241-58fe27858ba0 [Sclerotinia trifoliorum]